MRIFYKASHFMVVVLLSCILVQTGFASSDGPYAHFWHALPGTLFNFVLLIGVLIYLLRKPFIKLFRDRSEGIERTVKKNNEVYKETLSEYQRYEKMMHSLKHERDEMIQNAQKEGARLVEAEKKNGQKVCERYKEEVKNTLILEEGGLKRTLMLELLGLSMDKLIEESKQASTGLDPIYLSKFKEVGNRINLLTMT